MSDVSSVGLSSLEQRLKYDLDCLDWAKETWVPHTFHNGQRVRDVVVIGGGMAGLVASASLRRLGMLNHVVYDKAPAGREGPWITFARMITLRSPKQLTGPSMGIPTLTYRAYHEARFGKDAWAALDKIPRDTWMDYLVWYRKVLNLPVQNEVTLVQVAEVANGVLQLTLETPSGVLTDYARHLVLATGRDGLGGPFVPDFLSSIDRRFWAHTAHDIDFAALAGRRVGVIGAGASSMDNAATALEAGAGRVDMFIRRADFPRINKLAGINSAGITHGFAALPDEWKWQFLDHAFSAQTPPPRDSTRRVSRHPNAHFHMGSPMNSVEERGDHLLIRTPKGEYEIDFLIAGTGFHADLGSRAELAAFTPHVRLWSDGMIPEGVRANAELAGSPYLGATFEFTEKVAGACPALERIHCFNFPSTLSHGKLTGDIPAISEGADRLARGIASSLFVADRAVHYTRLEQFNVPELLGDEWTDADQTEAATA